MGLDTRIIIPFILIIVGTNLSSANDDSAPTHRSIEGKVTLPKGYEAIVGKDWISRARILVNYGEFVGFIRFLR